MSEKQARDMAGDIGLYLAQHGDFVDIEVNEMIGGGWKIEIM